MKEKLGTEEKSLQLEKLPLWKILIFMLPSWAGLYFTFEARSYSFYQVEVGLGIILLTIGYIVFTIWDAANDFILSYFIDRPNRLWPKYGKQLPWLIIGFVLAGIFGILLFNPPGNDQITLFVWYIVMICLFDSGVAITQSAVYSLYTQYVPDEKNRMTQWAIWTVINLPIGIINGLLVANLIIYGDVASYSRWAITYAIIGWFIFAAGAYFLRPSPIIRELVAKEQMLYDQQKSNLLRNVKVLFTSRNYLVMWINNLAASGGWIIIFIMLPYFVRFVFGLPATAEATFRVLSAIGSFFGVAIGYITCVKTRKLEKITIVIFTTTIVVLTVLFFVRELLLAATMFGILAGLVGAGTVSLQPLRFRTYDEVALNGGERMDALATGVWRFTGQLPQVWTAAAIAIVQGLTGFNPALEVQTELAKNGIAFLISLYPMFYWVLTLIIFWVGWNLTEERHKEIRVQLREKNLI